MILCIDSGNTRIKWGVHDGSGWRERGALAQSDAAALADLPRRLPVPAAVMLANVAGDAARMAIRRALAPWLPALCEVRTVPAAAGVTNLYDDPARLGVDRWCALVGARGTAGGACLVVMAGTATTIDALDAAGNFLGGLILPGLDMMRRALATATADLPLAAGKHVDFPRCTDDAIVTGCLEAQAGAIERAAARLGSGATCLLCGGAAEAVSRVLTLPHRLLDNLVLDGLVRLAAAASAGQPPSNYGS